MKQVLALATPWFCHFYHRIHLTVNITLHTKINRMNRIRNLSVLIIEPWAYISNIWYKYACCVCHWPKLKWNRLWFFLAIFCFQNSLIKKCVFFFVSCHSLLFIDSFTFYWLMNWKWWNSSTKFVFRLKAMQHSTNLSQWHQIWHRIYCSTENFEAI